MTDLDLARGLYVARRDREHQRAVVRAEVLPFGDGYLDDDRPDFHGATPGINRHHAAGEPLCSACSAWVDELVAAGLARRSDDLR